MAFKPFQEVPISLGNLQDEMNKMFERVWHGGVSTGPFDGQAWAPPIELHDFADRYVLTVEVPGVEAGDIDVSFVSGAVRIQGEKKRCESSEGAVSLRCERRYGVFSRSVEMPSGIEAEKMSAKWHGGVLEITVPKSESSKPRSIKVDIDAS